MCVGASLRYTHQFRDGLRLQQKAKGHLALAIQTATRWVGLVKCLEIVEQSENILRVSAVKSKKRRRSKMPSIMQSAPPRSSRI